MRVAPEPSRHATEAQCNLQRTKADQLWTLFVSWGDRGTRWSSYAVLSKDLKDKYREAFFENMVEEVPYDTVASGVRAYLRWRRWCSRNRHAEKEPAALVVPLFLRSLRAKGHTAPHGVYTGLRWLETST